MGVDGRGGRETDRLPMSRTCRRVAVLSRNTLDEVEDLLLALGQVHAFRFLDRFSPICGRASNVCSEI